MTVPGSEMPSYPQGSTAAFSVAETFPAVKGHHGLLLAANGDVFFVQLITEGSRTGGGRMVSILLPASDVTLTVERSFAAGYLVLEASGTRYFATLVAPSGR